MSDEEKRYRQERRDFFAAAAMQGILGNAAILERHGLDTATVAQDAVGFADALLAALAKDSQ